MAEGWPIQILYRREIVNNYEWLEISQFDGQAGWVPAMYVNIRP